MTKRNWKAICAVALCAAATLCATTASAQPALDDESPRFVPTFAVETGLVDEELRFVGPESTASETRSLLYSRLSVGLAVGIRLPQNARGSLRSLTELGVGLNYQRGSWPLSLRQAFLYERSLATRFAGIAGLDFALDLDFRDPRMSRAEVGVPIGFRAGPFELIYRPFFAVRLSQEESQFGLGERQRRTRTWFNPFHVVLRFHFRSLISAR